MSVDVPNQTRNVQPLDERSADPDALTQFRSWWNQAQRLNLDEPSAMTLATATPDGKPSARIVLLKDFDEHGFVFYTNYESRKGKELASNPHAALLFYWDSLWQQVRIEGRVQKVPRAVSDAYFHSRPRESQLSASASHQSDILQNRLQLEFRVGELTRQYADEAVPRPDDWGGYRLEPATMEFWQGRPNRLHDRLRYSRQGQSWLVERLAP